MRQTRGTSKFSRISVAIGLVAGAAIVPLAATPASAAPSDGYPTWTVEGSARAYTGDLTLPEGFPAVTFESDSRQATSPTGASTWIPEATAFGAMFGSSEGKPYLNLRPMADNATSPSTTTYTFASPTPVGTWAINLGDIDAEVLTVTATDAGGQPVSGANLGLQTPYNYCDVAASSCAPDDPAAVPVATVSGTSVSASEPDCPGDSCDTAGAAIWLMPQVPLSTLTVVSTWVSGLPTYQTWFATVANAISGTVTADCTLPAGLSVQLLDESDAVVATSPVGPDGSFSFPLVAGADYSVQIDPALLPDGVTSAPVPADNTGGDATADLAIVSSFGVTGSVSSADLPVGELGVELSQGDTVVQVAETDEAGAYAFDGIANGDYVVTVEPPAQAHTEPSSVAVTVDCAAATVAAIELIDDTPTEPTDPPTDPSSPPSDPTTPPGSSGNGSAGQLPSTGAETLVPFSLAALLVVLGAAAVAAEAVRRRRSSFLSRETTSARVGLDTAAR